MHEFFEKIAKFNNIMFDEEWHSYTLNGIKMVSVTKVTGSVMPPFDSKAVSTKCVAKMKKEALERGLPEPTITPEELANQWAVTNLLSRAKGSAVHKFLEVSLMNKVQRYPVDIVQAEYANDFKKNPAIKFDGDPVKPLYDACVANAQKFLNDIRGKMFPVKSELVIGSEKYGVCGMVDQIFYNPKSGGFEIWDWKTNSEFDTTSKYHLEPPCAHLEKCKLTEYSLQLHCYKKIFEEETGIPIKNLYLCWFSEKEPTYKVFKCLDVANEANILLTTVPQKLNAAARLV